MAKHRTIYNDDFCALVSHDQGKFNYPATAEEFAGLVERVRGTGITTYVMDSIEYDNKVYFETEWGIDWAKIDFTKYGPNWYDGPNWYAHFGEDWDKHYGAAARLMLKMRAQGREPLQVVIDSCRDMGLEVLAGIRMNDCHQGIQPLSTESPDISFFLKEHPEYAFCFPGTDERTHLADYSHKAVRDYRFGVLQELMEKFDYDGIELNWLRFPYLFQPDERRGDYGYINEERFAQLAPIMTQWTVEIRHFLDEQAKKKGKDRPVFGVRVPETPQIIRAIGIDLPAWIREAELDYIVPSGFHSTYFNIPVEKFKAMCQGTNCAVYPSLFPNVANIAKSVRTYQTEIYAAAAQTYYAGGADGVEVFNHFHPACKDIGLPFNAEALNVIASPEALAKYPIHHYYIMYSAEPADVPDCAKMKYTGFRGTYLPETRRKKFEFRFGEDLAKSPRRLTRLRFKIFDMTPEDKPPRIWLNDTELNYDRQWRQRFVYKNMHLASLDEDLDDQTVNWRRAKDYKDLEHLAGVPIADGDKALVLDLLAKPIWRRPEWVKMFTGEGNGVGRDIFMLVEADVSSIPPAALHKGVNRLWVLQLGSRRKDFMFGLYMGELELVTTLQ